MVWKAVFGGKGVEVTVFGGEGVEVAVIERESNSGGREKITQATKRSTDIASLTTRG